MFIRDHFLGRCYEPLEFSSLQIMTVPARGIFATFHASVLFVFNEKNEGILEASRGDALKRSLNSGRWSESVV